LENEIQILWTQYLVVLVLKNSLLEISTLGITNPILTWGHTTRIYWQGTIHVKVAINELLCLKNVGAQIAMDFS
jgi:hypothetical protein